MKVLLLGPYKLVDKMEEALRKNFTGLEISAVKYISYIEAPELLEQYKAKVDVVLFAGKSPFRLCEEKVRMTLPYEYLPRHESTLLKCLLSVNYSLKKSITHITMDTFDRNMMQKACGEVGIEVEWDQMFFASQDYLRENYVEELKNFHCKNYYERGASACITGLEEVAKEMQKVGIPTIHAQQTEDIIVQTMKNLQMRYTARKNSENQIVVIGIELHLPSEYSVVKDEEYAYLSHRIKLLDKIYAFNHLIDGVVVENSRSEFMIFTTKKTIETETDYYQNFHLLDMLREISVFTVSIGIGYGKTASDSKFNAFQGIKLAERHGGNAGFVVFENGNQMGPLETGCGTKTPQNFDEKFYIMSQDVGVSVNMAYKIFNGILKTKKWEFTSKELAGTCGVSVRTMDRVVTKLCDAGYCEVIGEKLLSQYGRPSRILRFKADSFY